MSALVLVVLVFVFIKVITDIHIRNLILHPFNTVSVGIKDIYKYFKYKKYNNCTFYGKVIALVSSGTQSMGCGKTLGGVWLITNTYYRYEGKTVWNDDEKKWDVQHIKVLSNVEFKNIPYIPLKSTEQITEFHKSLSPCDVGIVFIDEGGAELNARNFKTNISSKMLKQLVTCRHTHFGMVLTSQTFDMLDALLRKITDTVYLCSKKWRSCMMYSASARDVELVDNINYLDVGKTWYFASDSLYSEYDTEQMVDDLVKEWEKGNILTDDEEIKNLGNNERDLVSANLNKKYFRRFHKR